MRTTFGLWKPLAALSAVLAMGIVYAQSTTTPDRPLNINSGTAGTSNTPPADSATNPSNQAPTGSTDTTGTYNTGTPVTSGGLSTGVGSSTATPGTLSDPATTGRSGTSSPTDPTRSGATNLDDGTRPAAPLNRGTRGSYRAAPSTGSSGSMSDDSATGMRAPRSDRN